MKYSVTFRISREVSSMPRKQKSGLYRTKITVGYDRANNPVFKYISARTKAELEDERQKAITHYIVGSISAKDRLFGEYAVEWYRLR